MDIKVLKSFVSAHDAVNWASQNRIEDTSIETTGTLKSMGMGPVPSGNYHVVLKAGRVSDAIADMQSDDPSQRGRARSDAKQDYLLTDYNRRKNMADALDVRDPVAHSDAVGGTTSAWQARSNRLNALYDALADAYGGDDVLRSISYNDLVEVITKSVMDVLKGGDDPPEFYQSTKQSNLDDGIYDQINTRNIADEGVRSRLTEGNYESHDQHFSDLAHASHPTNYDLSGEVWSAAHDYEHDANDAVNDAVIDSLMPHAHNFAKIHGYHGPDEKANKKATFQIARAASKAGSHMAEYPDEGYKATDFYKYLPKRIE